MDDIERFIRDLISAEDVVIDVGANRGLYTEVFAELASSVYCLEPNPHVFGVLQESIRASNVTLIQAAASDSCSEIGFYLDTRPNLGGVASSVNVLDDLHAQNMVEKVSVQATTIDHLCETH